MSARSAAISGFLEIPLLSRFNAPLVSQINGINQRSETVTVEGGMEWIPASNPPDSDRNVLIWWKRQGWNSHEGVDMGNFCHALGYWRPRGTNGNFNDEVTHWMELPPEPPK